MSFRVAVRANGEVISEDEFDVTIIGTAATADCGDAEAMIIAGAQPESIAFQADDLFKELKIDEALSVAVVNAMDGSWADECNYVLELSVLGSNGWASWGKVLEEFTGHQFNSATYANLDSDANFFLTLAA
jgi:hypothetical protein